MVSPAISPEIVLKSLRIFVVENHPDTLLSIRVYLESLGHSVASARNMNEALDLLPASDLQVLLSDIGLPDGTGWELLQRAKLPPKVFKIAMSGFGLNCDNERSEQAGFRHHLLKPFAAGELEAVLEEAARIVK